MINYLIYLTEQEYERASLVGETLGYILVGVLVLIALILIPILIIGAYQQEKDQREYIKNLNEHDKSIICEYKNLTRWFPKTKKEKEQSK